jgi:hypothetical protein
MPNMRHHFAALLSNIEPSPERKDLASRLPGEVRAWLQEHEYSTSSPHTRLIGSYRRSTAVGEIKDIDILVFVPESQLDRTPNAVLRELKTVLDDYPDATATTEAQRRSIHLEFPASDVHLDIVPAVAEDLEEPLELPDRPQEEWIQSDPLGYGRRLSELNQKHGEKVVPLIKLFKAWRDVQMKTRRPKSYVQEVIVLEGVEKEDLTLVGNSTERNVADLFAYVADRFHDLMENGKEGPRIRDPQLPQNLITLHWERSHFETFMRRVREARRLGERAMDAETEDERSELWAKVFGDFWPTQEEVEAAARAEALQVKPGQAIVTASGGVLGPGASGVRSRPTRYHGE